MKTKNVGQVSSILYIVFGSIGAGLTCIAGFIGLIFSAFGFGWGGFTYFTLLLLFLIFILMIKKGTTERGRLSRMRRYISLFGSRMYMNIEDLAAQTHKSISYVLKDIRKMLSLGFFPEGHRHRLAQSAMLIVYDALH